MSKLLTEFSLPQMSAASSGVHLAHRTAAIIAVLAAMMLVVLDAAIANVALPSIARSLDVTPAMSVLIVTAYQMALVMALLPCAALGESLGYRRVFIAGVAMFTLASALCAVSPSLPWLVAARFLQGLGGAAVMALGVALLRFVVPHGQLGAAIGWNALVIALSSAAGPTIGALILSGTRWPWLFAVNLPVGVVVLLASRALPRLPARHAGWTSSVWRSMRDPLRRWSSVRNCSSRKLLWLPFCSSLQRLAWACWFGGRCRRKHR